MDCHEPVERDPWLGERRLSLRGSEKQKKAEASTLFTMHGTRQADDMWTHAGGEISLDPPLVMAVVNITPDSFYDGGRWIAADSVAPNASVIVAQCRRWRAQGADIFDLGGESTRPGAARTEPEAELARILPAIDRLLKDEILSDVPLSVDTRHASVARVCLERGVAMINDVSGLADPEMAAVVAGAGAGLVINHMRGTPTNMQDHTDFEDLVSEVADELAAAVERACAAGLNRRNILVDPGIGFGKTARQSAALVVSARKLEAKTACKVLIGASRKSFLGTLTGRPVEGRLLASVCSAVLAVEHGAAVVRVHDVAETVEALKVHRGIVDAVDSIPYSGDSVPA